MKGLNRAVEVKKAEFTKPKARDFQNASPSPKISGPFEYQFQYKLQSVTAKNPEMKGMGNVSEGIQERQVIIARTREIEFSRYNSGRILSKTAAVLGLICYGFSPFIIDKFVGVHKLSSYVDRLPEALRIVANIMGFGICIAPIVSLGILLAICKSGGKYDGSGDSGPDYSD